MATYGIEEVGLFIRYLYILIIKKKKISWKELRDKTEYGRNIGYIRTSNHNIGSLTSLVLFIFLIIINYIYY